jgi:hypothetical protein
VTSTSVSSRCAREVAWRRRGLLNEYSGKAHKALGCENGPRGTPNYNFGTQFDRRTGTEAALKGAFLVEPASVEGLAETP